jgi:hypothetical protein
MGVVRQYKMRYILCLRCNGKNLVNISCNAISDLADMGRGWSTHDEKRFVSSLAWEEFAQHILGYIIYRL